MQVQFLKWNSHIYMFTQIGKATVQSLDELIELKSEVDWCICFVIVSTDVSTSMHYWNGNWKLALSTSKSCKSNRIQALQWWDTISTQLILMPFNAEAQRTFYQTVPNQLYLKYDEKVRCMHGKHYYSGDPVANRWRVGNKDATLVQRLRSYVTV